MSQVNKTKKKIIIISHLFIAVHLQISLVIVASCKILNISVGNYLLPTFIHHFKVHDQHISILESRTCAKKFQFRSFVIMQKCILSFSSATFWPTALFLLSRYLSTGLLSYLYWCQIFFLNSVNRYADKRHSRMFWQLTS